MRELDSQTYQKLVQAGDRVPFEPLLDPMLIPRVPGTQNHVKVREVSCLLRPLISIQVGFTR